MILKTHNFHHVAGFPRSHHICDQLSQNKHKVATAAIWNYYRFIFFIMQALKWYMICEYCSLFCPAKINILCWFSFVFYCSVTHSTGYISVYKLATLHSFCGSRSHMCSDMTSILKMGQLGLSINPDLSSVQVTLTFLYIFANCWSHILHALLVAEIEVPFDVW